MRQIIMYGKDVAEKYRTEIAKKITNEKKRGKKYTLALILAGNDGASVAYLKRITKLIETLGGQTQVFQFAQNVKAKEIFSCIEKLNKNKNIDGIMPLMPMPKQIDSDAMGNAILPAKDMDCLNSINIGELYSGRSNFAPATARSCLAILKYYKIKLDGKKAVVLGRSNVVGKPVANLLLNENCTVTICHSHTKNLAKICREADIIIAAVGKANFLKANMIKEGAVLVDVGINVTKKGIVGDVSPLCYKKAKAYSPVPGGVGVVCNMMLAERLVL